MTKEQWVEQFKKDGLPTKIAFNPFGSVQYSTVYELYKLFFDIRKDLSLNDTCNVLGITKIAFKCNHFNDIKIEFLNDILKEEKDNWEKGENHTDELTLLVKNAKSADDLMTILRDLCWDLWEAAGYIESIAFDTIIYDELPESPGIGPEGNIDAQSYNYNTGLCCALLTESGLIKNIKSFDGFCT